MDTKQLQAWSGGFGAEYTDRNNLTAAELDAAVLATLGVTRSALIQEFLGGLPRNIRILEVGTNVGIQLELLANAGFENLYGIELQWRAIDLARQRVPRANIVQGTAFELPFRDGFFDLVYTSGVLIHIAPGNLPQALREIHRCSSRFIWGHEYFATEMTEVRYRGEDGLMWKGDYARSYRELFPELSVLAERRVPWLPNSDIDCLYLLGKPGATLTSQ